MIRVTRIAGESFDFDTRQELPKALILSNGKREFSLYVDDETAQAVLEMMLETAAAPPAPAKANGSPARSVPNTPPAPKRPVAQKPAAPPNPPPMATVGDDPEPEESDDNTGYEPGEEYNDPATGAESL